MDRCKFPGKQVSRHSVKLGHCGLSIHAVTLQTDFILGAFFFTDRPNFHFRASMIF
nr:MAG TPA: hypothetical protein [Caudoviricetes sp.]